MHSELKSANLKLIPNVNTKYLHRKSVFPFQFLGYSETSRFNVDWKEALKLDQLTLFFYETSFYPKKLAVFSGIKSRVTCEEENT